MPDQEQNKEYLFDQLFSPVRRKSLGEKFERQTFSKSNPRLKKKSHALKVIKYARLRLEHAEWDLLGDLPNTGNSMIDQVPFFQHKQIKIDRLIGEGSFSSVYSMKDNQDTVIKTLRSELLHNPPMLATCAADLVKEAVLLNLLQGESNILQILGWQRDGLLSYQNGHHDAFFILLERLDCTLRDRITEWQKQRNRMKNVFARSKPVVKFQLLQERLEIIPQLAKGISNLHKYGIIHRDLKPDNIGYCPTDNQWKLFDLDVARLVPAKEGYSEDFCLTKCAGSKRYMSPECGKGERYNCTTDVYSFALLVHEILTFEKPYDDISAQLHDEEVFYDHVRPKLHKDWPESLKNFLDSAWNKDWRCRVNLTTCSDELDQVLVDFAKYKQGRYALLLDNKKPSFKNRVFFTGGASSSTSMAISNRPARHV